MMQLGLQDKIAIVTGGSKGIGFAIAQGLLREGSKVVICARDPKGLEEASAKLDQAQQARLLAVSADLTDRGAAKRVTDACIERFGRVDILCNNAGSARAGEFLKITDEEWLEDWMLKYFGYVRMVREVFPYMQKQHKGVILNVIGMGGFMPSAKYMPGGAINAACNHFTKALGEEGSNHGIRVVGINPGAVLTERLWRQLKARSGTDDLGEALKMYNPLGRAAQPEEVADLALFLVSDRAEYIHATNVTIDGGGGHITLVN